MRTPKEYAENLKNGIITEAMLLDCLYSANKRAKNYRDKAREYRAYYRSNRYAYDKYGNVDKCTEKKAEYYRQKEKLLSILTPTCIHREIAGYERIRIYDYDPEYKKHQDDFVWENCFYDYASESEVWFGDIEDESHPKYRYYLFYDLNETKTFHSPIKESDVGKYDLEVITIDQLETAGHDVSDLISNQFVRKVLDLIDSKNYRLAMSQNKRDSEIVATT